MSGRRVRGRPTGRRADRGPSRGLEARQAAVELLQAVLVRHTALDEALQGHAALTHLSTLDRAFARSLIATTLRRLGQIDQALSGRLTKPLAAAPAPVQAILRLGVAQGWFLRTPAHAVVATATELAARNGPSAMTGMVNAVLRALTVEPSPTPTDDEAGRVNMPSWLWDRLAAAYGERAAGAIAAAHLADPPLDITVKDRPEDWAARLNAAMLPTGSLRRIDGGAVATLPGYDTGAWWVQDAAAALPARLLGDVAGRRVIDLCAAPGGKTAQLAAAGAQVTAVDRAPARLARLADNLSRLALSAELVEADAASWRPDAPADAVLLDAPCTATGTIRRHPDIPYLKRPADLAAMAETQARLLDHAVGMLAPGGVLIWCTCSLLPEEGEMRIDALLRGGAPVARDPIRGDELPGLADAITPLGEVRTLPSHWPDRGGLDGFHVSRLRRVA